MAMRSAQYFEAIALQDAAKAWTFHDRVFATQNELAKGEEHLRRLAGERTRGISFSDPHGFEDRRHDVVHVRELAA